MAQPSGPRPGALDFAQHAPCGLLQTREDGLIVWANETFCRWTGYAAAELAGARRLQDLLTMGGRIFHQTHWAPLLRMQGSISEVKLDLQKSDGNVLPIILNACLREVAGELLQEVAVYVARDRDKYERELLLARRKLEAAVAEATRLQSESKDRALFSEQMMGIVSHDLRNPLSAIQMGAALLRKLGTTPAQDTVLARISRSTERANRMIGDLLDFTQARMGQGLSVRPAAVALQALVHDCVDELKLAFPDRVLRHEAAGTDASCQVDPDRLTQLIGNLVANAMVYGARDRPVTVRSRIEERTFTVAVHNEGEPIPPDQLETIFLPLARGMDASSEGRNVGLGLFIVQAIAEAHGGTIRVRSDAAAGTQFEATLPR
jgi:sigma-B regulation protein RsbU (phosphoserine phosphatase)